MSDRPAAPALDDERALAVPAFRRYLAGRVVAVLGRNVFAVTVGWEIYEMTRSAYALAMVGLVEVVPVVALALYVGPMVDRTDRRRVAIASQLAMALCAAGSTWLAHAGAPAWTRYPLLFAYGCAVAFNGPATSALLPNLVPARARVNANAWSSTSWEIASIAGPALAGILIAWRGSAVVAYATHAIGAIVFVIALATLPVQAGRPPDLGARVDRDARAGLRFVLRSRYLLAAITLDMFAVLFGGVTALLPMFARDVLHVGPGGLGWMRAAPSIGAFAMALITTRLRPWRRPGVVLLATVIGFGVATIAFAVCHSYPWALFFLGLTGLFDNISVVIRLTLEQMVTPDSMRGRVGAIHYVFIGMSNQLGEFESGVAAGLLGPVGAALLGGVATIVVVLAVAMRWPALARAGPLADLKPEETGSG